jgi:hypothetical protein
MPTTPTQDKTLAATETFRLRLQEMLNKHYAERFSNLDPPRVVNGGGTKYLRIELHDTQQRIYAFVNIDTGDIYRPASWKKPDPKKHIRGNVFDEHGGMKWAGPYGVAYLEQMKGG